MLPIQSRELPNLVLAPLPKLRRIAITALSLGLGRILQVFANWIQSAPWNDYRGQLIFT